MGAISLTYCFSLEKKSSAFVEVVRDRYHQESFFGDGGLDP
jgi:hypothetical protein